MSEVDTDLERDRIMVRRDNDQHDHPTLLSSRLRNGLRALFELVAQPRRIMPSSTVWQSLRAELRLAQQAQQGLD